MTKKYFLGIDLGGTKVAGAVFDSVGMISPKEAILMEGKRGVQVGDQILKLVDHFMEWAVSRSIKLDRIGVAVPGIYYPETGAVWAPNIPGWESYPLKKTLIDHVGHHKVEIIIDSDRTCYILGELWKGVAKDCKHVIFLAVGTGIGAGILVDGRIIRGANNIAGAIGWLAVTHPYLPDYKTYGCFEYHASGLGITRMAQDLLSDKKTNLIGADGIQPNKITAHHVFEAFEAGDPIAEKVIQRSIEFWGKASANLVSLFNPEKIIFGGGVFGPAAQFIDQIYNEAKKWAQPISIGLTKFEPSTFGHEAGLYGAGYLAMKSEESF